MSYRLIYTNNGMFGLFSERMEYEEGEPVRVVYNAVMTDTSYTVSADADDVKTEFGDSGIVISFTMPAHDVKVSVSSRSAMSPWTEPRSPFFQTFSPKKEAPAANIADNAPAPQDGETWSCPFCAAQNTGRFCSVCGSPRPGPKPQVPAPDPADPQAWTCPDCGGVNTGKFCQTCGRPRPSRK